MHALTGIILYQDIQEDGVMIIPRMNMVIGVILMVGAKGIHIVFTSQKTSGFNMIPWKNSVIMKDFLLIQVVNIVKYVPRLV